MKVKEIEKTVNSSWSPADHHPILLAAGTAAQQLDASFNTSAALEIYALNLADSSLDLELKTSVPSQHRFHKVVWGGERPGVIVGGCDNGVIQMYKVNMLLNQESNPLIANPERHTGPVRSLDFNPFQKNLLATGATNSEIFIWDLNNTATPMTPGAKSQPFEDVAWLAWNRQVQHILASTFPTRSVVWDLRKNEPIIKLTDTTTRVRWKVVAWHPEVATQLCLASEEDANPVVQLWDLRFATAPVKTFQGHSRGVLSLAWCSQDPDLLISSGKDNRILCWNPNATETDGEIVCEIPNSQQWIFDVSWCPKNPSLIVSSSCDGHTSVYSLTGSTRPGQLNNKIADSFPGMGNYSDTQVHAPQPVVDLKKAPKWLKRPVGATFGFGGKLVTFGPDGVKLFQTNVQTRCLGSGLVERSKELRQKVDESRYFEICQGKQDPLWRYLEASFSDQPAFAIRDLLGYNKDSVLKVLGVRPKEGNEVDSLSDQLSSIGRDGNDPSLSYDNQGYNNREVLNGGDIFDSISAQNSPEKRQPIKINVDSSVDGKICRALLTGSVEEAIDMCLEENKMADALILGMVSGPEVLARTQKKYFQKRDGFLSKIISALLNDDWKEIINNCELTSWKEALAGVLTFCPDSAVSELAEKLGRRLEQAGGELALSAEICYIASGNVAPLVHKRTTGVSLTSDNLQELVELILVAQGAMQSRGLELLLVDEIASLMGQYSEVLASEGELDAALHFVKDCRNDEVDLLRDRLLHAIGQRTQPQYTPGYQQPKKVSFSAGNVKEPLVPAFKPQPQYPAQQYPPQQYPAQPATPVNQVPPPPVPGFPRNSPSPQIQTKKYVVDPSVAGSGFRGNQNYQPVQNQPQQQPFGFQQPQKFGYGNQYPSGDSFPTFPAQTYTPSPAAQTIFTPQQNIVQHGPPQPPVPSAQHAPPSGWNDPPPMVASKSKPASKMEPVAQAPITHPIFGSNVQPMTPQGGQYPVPGNQFPAANQFPGQPRGAQFPGPVNNQFSAPSPSPGQFPQQFQPVPPQNQPTVGYGEPPSPGPPRPPSVAKTPLPQQYQHIQSTLEELRSKCVTAASNNPLMKRKLDDVAKRLETLYDHLRDERLSPSTVAGIEQLVQCVRTSDWASGSMIFSQMASGSDFPQISSFFNGVKVLLQSAQHLGVH